MAVQSTTYRPIDITQHVAQLNTAHRTNPVDVQKTIHSVLKELVENLKIDPRWIDVQPEGGKPAVKLSEYVNQLIKNNDLPGAKALAEAVKGNREAMIPLAAVNVSNQKNSAKFEPARIPLKIGKQVAVKAQQPAQAAGTAAADAQQRVNFQQVQSPDRAFTTGKADEQGFDVADEGAMVCLKRLGYLD